MSKEETVEITVQIPKPLMNTLEAFWQFIGYTDQTAKEYLAERVARDCSSLIGDILFNEMIDFADDIIENYKLEPFRKYMDVPKRI